MSIYMIHYSAETKIVYISMATSWWDIHKISANCIHLRIFIGPLMPCPFTGPKMFWAGTIFLCQTKNLFTYCGSHKHFVPDKKMICIGLCAGTKRF